MSIRSNIATVTADLARWGLRSVLHRNGGALPGKLALSIDPELVADLAPPGRKRGHHRHERQDHHDEPHSRCRGGERSRLRVQPSGKQHGDRYHGHPARGELQSTSNRRQAPRGRVRVRRAVHRAHPAAPQAHVFRLAQPVPRPARPLWGDRPYPGRHRAGARLVANDHADLQCRRPAVRLHRRPRAQSLASLWARWPHRRRGLAHRRVALLRPLQRPTRIRLHPIRSAGLLPLPRLWLEGAPTSPRGPRTCTSPAPVIPSN